MRFREDATNKRNEEKRSIAQQISKAIIFFGSFLKFITRLYLKL